MAPGWLLHESANAAVLIGLAILGFGFARSTEAHRLDEYLQATRISIEFERIGLEMSLTPGAAVADNVFAGIDHDHNGKISAAESAAYARLVVAALKLSVDGESCMLTLDRYYFHNWPICEMVRGLFGCARLRRFPDRQSGRIASLLRTPTGPISASI